MDLFYFEYKFQQALARESASAAAGAGSGVALLKARLEDKAQNFCGKEREDLAAEQLPRERVLMRPSEHRAERIS
jgi:hypothetical protein